MVRKRFFERRYIIIRFFNEDGICMTFDCRCEEVVEDCSNCSILIKYCTEGDKMINARTYAEVTNANVVKAKKLAKFYEQQIIARSEFKITEIRRSRNETVVTAEKHNGLTQISGIARCTEDDRYILEIGISLAMERLHNVIFENNGMIRRG